MFDTRDHPSRRVLAAFACLLALMLCSALAAATPVEDRVKLQVSDPALAKHIQARMGGRLVADYNAFQVVEVDARYADDLARRDKVSRRDDDDFVKLNTGWVHTRSTEARLQMARTLGSFTGKRLHLVQFAGPVKSAWYRDLEQTGVQVVTYIPENAYLVYGDSAGITALQALARTAAFIQWEGAYEDRYKLQPTLLELINPFDGKEYDLSEVEGYAVQLVRDPEANNTTMGAILNLAQSQVVKDNEFLGYRNVLVRGPLEAAQTLSTRTDVVSIHPWFRHKLMDERQNIILTNQLTGNAPTAPGYYAWLTGKGFTQAQFTTSNFVVDVTDSGIDNATTTPNHFGLYVGGNTTAASRVAYRRTVGTAGASAGKGCDGHGNLNSHIVAGYIPESLTGSPHQDASGYYYGQGVCPFVKVGSSTIFDPGYSNPDFENLQSQAYNDGARISTNSWGAAVGGAYNADSQAYDYLVRDAQPTGSTYEVAGNQQMVICFSAGNSGSSANTIGSPGTGKNIFCIGATENVHPFGGADQCGTTDAEADSANDVVGFSSRGPCDDGRIKPDIQAPGTHVSGGVYQNVLAPWPVTGNGTAGTCYDATGVCGGPAASPNFWPAGQQWTTASSGTSHSCPAVAGASALLRQYFINNTWTVPSPAMNKAFLMNSTRYMTGVSANDTLPSNNQGMGMVDLNMAFDGVARILKDQLPADLFTDSGQSRTFTGTIADPAKPFRVTLAWTDAPGPTSGNAYVNNLDLTVTVGGNTYKGNVFTGSASVTGGAADARNNVESVFIPAGITGSFAATVTGANIAGDGVPGDADTTDQDFALVVYNATEMNTPVIGLNSTSLTAESCSPANTAPDPNETVTYQCQFQNVGSSATTNLKVSLNATGGVTSPSGEVTLGVVAAGATANASFTFTVSPSATCNGNITLTFTVMDGATLIGNPTQTLFVGTLITHNYSSGGLTLPIDATHTTVTAPIVITDAGVIKNPRVKVRINHVYDGDLEIKLIAPDATTVVLSDNRGSSGDNFGSGNTDCTGVFTVFSDSATTAISAGSAPFAGSYKPESVLSALNGKPLAGTWTLQITDTYPSSDHGTLYCWQLEYDSPDCCGWAGDPLIMASGSSITAEGCAPGNAAVDPGETVTVSLGLKNTGSGATSNLVADLQMSGGVQCPSAPQAYGVIPNDGTTTVSRSFSFTASSSLSCGSVVTATLNCVDGLRDLGTVTYTFTLGSLITSSTSFSNTAAISIPTTVGNASPYPSDITVSGMSGNITKVTATLTNFSHTYPSDVQILLVSPGGQKCALLAGTGGGTDVVNAVITFDQAAASTVPSTIVSGTYRPTGTISSSFPAPAPGIPYATSLDTFNGYSPNGTWSLYIRDLYSSDGGSISGGWSLTVTAGGRTCCVTPCFTADHPASTVDVNGDFTSDLLWRSTASGDLVAWLMDGTGVIGSAYVGGLADPNWEVAGLGDFNADSFFDIFLRNSSTGDLSIWLLDASGYAGSIDTLGSAPTDWKVVGVGDVDLDCRADIFWRNDAAGPLTGMLSLWFVDACGYRANSYLGGIGDLNWKVEGVADFNGDKVKDILWRHAVSGVMSIWFVNTAGNFASDMTPGTLDPVWQIVGLGDLNADQKADLFLVNTATGDLIAWLFNGSVVTAAPYIATLPSGDWQIAGTADIDGNGKSDVLLRNSVTGEIAVWFTTEAGLVGGMPMGPVNLAWQTQNDVIFAGGM
ncbi:MAG: S8 family serine peptidase [Acidobacteria bacterium]|nr:S8 family serine peptidase [Acidobacteriota bacterium]